MTDSTSGASGSSDAGRAADATAAADRAAAEATSVESQMADAAQAVGAAPTPSVTQETAPVDLTVSIDAVSQLSAMQVSTPTLDFSSVTSLGGIPSAPSANPSYADVAMGLATTPSTPATPTTGITELGTISPTFAVSAPGLGTTDIDDIDIGAVSVDLGLNYTGLADSPLSAASLQGRIGLDPASFSAIGQMTLGNDINSLTARLSAGPFGPAADPSYGISLESRMQPTDVDTLSWDGAASFDANGFKNGAVNAGVSHAFSENLSGKAKGGASFDADGLAGVTGELGLDTVGVNPSLGITGRGSYDPRTGEYSGYVGFGLKGRF